MKLFIYCMAAILLISCKQQPGEKTVKKISAPPQSIGKRYFSYDSVIYYHINFHDTLLVELTSGVNKSTIDSFKRGVILEQIPATVKDIAFIKELGKMGFEKWVLNKSLFVSIDSVFSEKPAGKRWAKACGQIYRDILIFKKADDVVGIAKICFSCGDYMIVGANANTEGFEQNSAFSKLAAVLKVK